MRIRALIPRLADAERVDVLLQWLAPLARGFVGALLLFTAPVAFATERGANEVAFRLHSVEGSSTEPDADAESVCRSLAASFGLASIRSV